LLTPAPIAGPRTAERQQQRAGRSIRAVAIPLCVIIIPEPSPEERLDQEREHAADRDAVHPLHETELGSDHGDVLGEHDDLLLERGDLLPERGDAAGQDFERLPDQVETLLDGPQPLLDTLKPLVDLVPPLVAAGEARGRGARPLLGGAGLLQRVVISRASCSWAHLWPPAARRSSFWRRP